MMESCDQDGNPYLGVFRGKEWLRNIKCYSPQDEAQEMPTECLNELRLLGSARFDSQCLLTTILCGDTRLPPRFRSPELLALGTRIRVRLTLEALQPQELLEFLDHMLGQAGAAHLMSQELKNALSEHAGGNLRLLVNMAADLLAEAADRELKIIDEQLYLELFSTLPGGRRKKTAPREST